MRLVGREEGEGGVDDAVGEPSSAGGKTPEVFGGERVAAADVEDFFSSLREE